MDDLPKPRNGRVLAQRRKELGISQSALAEALGIHRVTLYEWEQDKPLDVIRAAQYERALLSLVERAVA